MSTAQLKSAGDEGALDKLKQLAFKDGVTGLYDRLFFNIRLAEEINRHRKSCHPVSVVLMSLAGFEMLNEKLGREQGDKTLRGVAQILMQHTRSINVISRYDGGLFAVVLVETSQRGAASMRTESVTCSRRTSSLTTTP